MSEGAGERETDGDDLQSRVEAWLAGQMPIIQMHGGTSVVREADAEAGRVVVELGGSCAGCGVASRTTQNIKVDLAAEFDEVDDVVVRTGGGNEDWDLDRDASYMGIERNEGGRGGRGESSAHGDDTYI